MISLTVEVKGRGKVEEVPAKLQKALGLARRDAIKTLMGYAAKLASAENYIKQSEVKKAMTPQYTGFLVRGGMRGIEKYKLSPKRPGRKKYTLMGAVKRGGLKPLGRNAFLMRRGSNYIPVARTSKKRFPVKRLYGPAIPQLIGGEGMEERLAAKGEELFNSRAAYWTQRLLGVKS